MRLHSVVQCHQVQEINTCTRIWVILQLLSRFTNVQLFNVGNKTACIARTTSFRACFNYPHCYFKTKACAAVISISPSVLLHVCYPPVSVSCCQAVGVHVSLRCRRDAIAVHGSHHGVCSPLQQQAHQFKVTWSLKRVCRKEKVDFPAQSSAADSRVLRPLAGVDSDCVCTCGSGQLQRRLRVVLHPVLERPLHVGFGIQQQLQLQTGVMGGRGRMWWIFEWVKMSWTRSWPVDSNNGINLTGLMFQAFAHKCFVQKAILVFNANTAETLLKLILQIHLTF